MGKVNNTPFDKLYRLAKNCADQYYTSIIKTFIELIKKSTADHQVVLVNTACALMYLEDYGAHQSKLFAVLEKYDYLPEELQDLESEFKFLKETTSWNVTNLQQALNLHQACNTSLCSHINTLLTRVTKLETEVQLMQQDITMDQDIVHINAPDFDSDIDEPELQTTHTTAVVSVQNLLNSPESEISNAILNQETQATPASEPTTNNTQSTHRNSHSPSPGTQQVSQPSLQSQTITITLTTTMQHSPRYSR